MGIFAALFASGIGKTALKFLPYLIALFVVVGAYFYGHHKGTVSCRAKELEAVIEAQNKKMEELQKQYEDAQKVISTLNTKNNHIRDITKMINEKIAALPNPAGCEVNKEIINLINQARSGTIGAKK